MADEDDDLDEKELKAEADSDLDTDTPPEKEEKDEERPVEETPEDKDTEKEEQEADDYGDLVGDENATTKGASNAALRDNQTENEEKEQPKEEKEPENEAERENSADMSPLPSENELAPTRPSNPVLNRYQDYIEQYKKLQDQQRKGDLVNGLIAAGGKIGQSMAGKYSGNFVPDQNGNQMLAKMNEAPTQRFEQGMKVEQAGIGLQSEKEANDPNSRISEAYRNYFKSRVLPKNADGSPNSSMFPNIDKYSASDVQNLLKTIGRPTQESMRFVNATDTDPKSPNYGKTQMVKLSKTGQMYDAKGNQLSSSYVIQTSDQIMKDANGNVIRVNKNIPGMAPQTVSSSAYKPVESMTPQEVANFKPDINQRKALDTEQKRMDTMNKAAREGLQSADKLEQALKSNNVYQGATLKTTLPKLMGFNGRMSPLEQQMWQGSQAWKDRAEQYLQTAAEGTLTPENKQQALELLEDYKKTVGADLQNISEGSQQHLEQTHSIPRQFSAKATQMPSMPNGQKSDQVHIQRIEDGADLMIPRSKLQKFLDTKKYKEAQ